MSVFVFSFPVLFMYFTCSHCFHETFLSKDILALFIHIIFLSYAVTPQSWHFHKAHSFLGNSALHKLITLCSHDWKEHHVSSMALAWFLGIPLIPSPIKVSLIFAKFAQYSQHSPCNGVSCNVLKCLGFNASKVFSATFLLVVHFLI